jgi:HlyD family secretion protein
MKVKLLFIIAIIGIALGLISVFVYNTTLKNLPPVSVNYNPYENGVYATGILESNQKHGDNINIFPEVSGKVIAIYAEDGQTVKKGDPILYIDDSIEKSIVEKDKAQAMAAFSLLQELKAEPRKENLDVAKSQLDYADANLKNVQAQLDKIQKAYTLDKQSVSKNDLDNAINAVAIAKQNLAVAQNQYNLVKAGAWSYDITNQTNQYLAAVETYLSDKALLDKYLIKAPIDGVVLRINTATGDYISPAGSYGTFTQNMTPVLEMGVVESYLEVKCFLDEILTPRLPAPSKMEAKMFIRGENNKSVPLEFVKIQPYTIPKIELSNATQEKVDVRVLPVVFRFKKPNDINLYPGQLVDVYIRGKK